MLRMAFSLLDTLAGLELAILLTESPEQLELQSHTTRLGLFSSFTEHFKARSRLRFLRGDIGLQLSLIRAQRSMWWL